VGGLVSRPGRKSASFAAMGSSWNHIPFHELPPVSFLKGIGYLKPEFCRVSISRPYLTQYKPWTTLQGQVLFKGLSGFRIQQRILGEKYCGDEIWKP